MKALHHIQQKLHAPKGNYNKFGGFRYRSAEDILEAVKPLMAEVGATLTLSDEIILVEKYVFVKTIATLKADGEAEVVTGVARHAVERKGMDDAQITGSASSYARKYALSGLFAIDDEKDPDAEQAPAETPPPPPAPAAIPPPPGGAPPRPGAPPPPPPKQ